MRAPSASPGEVDLQENHLTRNLSTHLPPIAPLYQLSRLSKVGVFHTNKHIEIEN